MRYLITGAAGFIGSHFVRELMAGSYDSLGHDCTGVTVYDKLTYAGNLENLASVSSDPRYTFVEGDICDGDLLDEVLPGHDVVINFAAETHVDRSIHGPQDFIITNVVGTQTLLDACLRHGIPRTVHIGTDEVYGSIDVGSWTEDEPLLPNSPYSAAKAAAEMLVRAYSVTYGLNVSSTRCSNNYGPYQFPEKVIPLFVTNLIDGKKVPLYGDGLECARLAACGRSLPGNRDRRYSRSGRAVLQHRRRPGTEQQGAHRAGARGDGRRLVIGAAGGGP